MARSNRKTCTILPKAVAEIGKISITGNIVPPLWFKTITFESGKPDTNSILILSDILYWYRPTEVRDEQTGTVTGLRKKFHEDLLRRSYADFEAQFGLSKKQCQDCLRRLESLGAIKRVFRTLHSTAGRLNNVMYIDLVPSIIQQLTSMTHETPVFSGDKDPVEGDVSPYGDQSHEGGPSNSIGGDVEVSPCGDQAPHHIKDTNTSSETSLSQKGNASKKSKPVSKEAERENKSISKKMVDLWNDLVSEKTISRIDKFLKKDLEIAFREQLDKDFTSWKTVCENFKTSKFLMGEVDRICVKPDLSWLVNPKAPHVTRVLTKSHWTFDDRILNSKPTIDWEKIEAAIEALEEPLVAREVRLFVFQNDAFFYHDWLMRKSIIESDGKTVFMKMAGGFTRDRVEEKYGSSIRDFLKHKYQMGLEIQHKKV